MLEDGSFVIVDVVLVSIFISQPLVAENPFSVSPPTTPWERA
jgi:hypothetical protein